MADTPNEERSSNNRTLLVVGLILVLLSINGILLYMQRKAKNEVAQKEQEVQNKNAELEDQIKKFMTLKSDFERQSQELQQMGMTNDSLEARIAAVNADLLQLRAFRASSFSVADQKKFRARASSLEGIIRKKDEEIAKLKADNQQLFGENNELKTKQNEMTDSLTSLKSTKQALAQKVTMAQRLQTSMMKINIITNKGKEKADDEAEYKAKRVEKIKITYALARNDVADQGTKTVYLRLIEPDGSTLTQGGGTMTVDGQEQPYTASQEILFTNSNTPYTFVFSKGAAYKEGKHVVELYSNGFQIGTASFTLK
jgi:chromosome segregation ATPase